MPGIRENASETKNEIPWPEKMYTALRSGEGK